MDLKELLQHVDGETARAFVGAARRVIDAMLIEAEHIRAAQPPAARAYDEARLSRAAPAGGWLSHDELRGAARRLGEALAAEKWTDGLVCAVRLFGLLGAAP